MGLSYQRDINTAGSAHHRHRCLLVLGLFSWKDETFPVRRAKAQKEFGDLVDI